jgi:hypothetical protein
LRAALTALAGTVTGSFQQFYPQFLWMRRFQTAAAVVIKPPERILGTRGAARNFFSATFQRSLLAKRDPNRTLQLNPYDSFPKRSFVQKSYSFSRSAFRRSSISLRICPRSRSFDYKM